MPEELPELDGSPELLGILEPEEELDVPDEIPEPAIPEELPEDDPRPDDVWEDDDPELLSELSPELLDEFP